MTAEDLLKWIVGLLGTAKEIGTYIGMALVAVFSTFLVMKKKLRDDARDALKFRSEVDMTQDAKRAAAERKQQADEEEKWWKTALAQVQKKNEKLESQVEAHIRAAEERALALASEATRVREIQYMDMNSLVDKLNEQTSLQDQQNKVLAAQQQKIDDQAKALAHAQAMLEAYHSQMVKTREGRLDPLLQHTQGPDAIDLLPDDHKPPARRSW